MVKRPKPTSQLMLETCGGNSDLLGCLHHGLVETPSLEVIYPHLDFDELVAFAASSWRSRDRGQLKSELVPEAMPYDIFNYIFQVGMPWLRKYQAVSEKQRAKYERLNPFHGKDLKTRLERLPEEAAIKFFEEIEMPTREYVFAGQYADQKLARGGDSSNLNIMNFQNVYPKEGKNAIAFAKEISRILGSYTQDYFILQPKPAVQAIESQRKATGFLDLPSNELEIYHRMVRLGSINDLYQKSDEAERIAVQMQDLPEGHVLETAWDRFVSPFLETKNNSR